MRIEKHYETVLNFLRFERLCVFALVLRVVAVKQTENAVNISNQMPFLSSPGKPPYTTNAAAVTDCGLCLFVTETTSELFELS